MTTSPELKEIKSIAFEGWDVPAYGPQGKHTREEWREECLVNLLAGKAQFKAWQESWKVLIDENLPNVSFAVDIIFENDTKLSVLTDAWVNEKPFVLDFSALTFDEIVYCEGYEFQSAVLFRSSIFKSFAIFDFTKFSHYMSFRGATFEKEAYFRNTEVSGDSDFRKAVFVEYVDFVKIKFMNQSLFEESTFGGKIDFESSEFQNVGHFERSQFIGELPSFLGVDNAKTLLVFSGDEYFNKSDTHGNAIDRIAQLKRLAEEQGQTDQILMFNAFELNAKTKQPDASCIFIVFTWLYAKVSNYGRSFGRPLLTYLGLVLITYIVALLYAANSSPQNCKGEFWRVFIDWRDNKYPSCISYELPDDKFKLNGYRAAFEYTTYRAAGILDFSDNDKQTVAVSKRLFNADVEPTWMRFWGIFKAIASAALLFLAALGLRNKYRIK